MHLKEFLSGILVFDDGDEKTLRRTQCVLKGEKHFIESEVSTEYTILH